MSQFHSKDDPEESRKDSVATVLAEMTGRPRSDFESDEDYDFPELDELESVPEDEW